MKKLLFIFILLISIFVSAYSYDISIDKIFSDAEIDLLLKGEIITRRFMKYNPANLNTHEKIDVPKSDFTDKDYSEYEVVIDEKAFFPYEVKDKTSLLKIYNLLNNASLGKGMRYYSNRAGEVKEFIVESYAVDKDKTWKKIQDVESTEIPDKTESFLSQKDNRFGKLLYKKTIYNEKNNFYVVTECLDPIVFFVALNNKGDYSVVSYFMYDENKKGYFYYSVMATRIRNEFILKKGYTNATLFSSRLRALTVHFAKLIGLDWTGKLKELN